MPGPILPSKKIVFYLLFTKASITFTNFSYLARSIGLGVEPKVHKVPWSKTIEVLSKCWKKIKILSHASKLSLHM